MTDTEKREALQAAESRLNIDGHFDLASKMLAIAADYDDTPADAEWVGKREGWEKYESGDGRLYFRGMFNFAFFTPETSSFMSQLSVEDESVYWNPTRAQVIALERAVGGSR